MEPAVILLSTKEITLDLFKYIQSPLTRRCTSPTTIKNIKIPLNMAIAVDVLSIHYDPELWGPTDPKLFYPSR